MSLYNAVIVSILAITGWAVGSLLAACGIGVVIAIVNAQRNRTRRVS